VVWFMVVVFDVGFVCVSGWELVGRVRPGGEGWWPARVVGGGVVVGGWGWGGV
jgi:hypothetical protein